MTGPTKAPPSVFKSTREVIHFDTFGTHKTWPLVVDYLKEVREWRVKLRDSSP